MRYFTKADLEVIAARIMAKYLSLLDEPYRVTFINPVALAEIVFGLKVDYFRYNSDSMLGFTNTSEGTMVLELNETILEFEPKTIYINDRLLAKSQEGRHNFTVAHEIAHHAIDLLRSKYPDEYSELDTVREEQQADYLASCILMPKPFMKNVLAYSRFQRIELLSMAYKPSDFQRFSKLADRLHVSMKALEIRLINLGYIGKSYYWTEKDTITIYPEDKENRYAG